MWIVTRSEVARIRRLTGEDEQTAVAGRKDLPARDYWRRSVPAILLEADIGPRQFGKLCAKAAGVFAGGVVLGLLLGPVWIVAGIVLGALVVFVGIKRRVFARAEAFERDYPAFLISLASSIRTGLDPLSALMQSERLFGRKSIVRSEILKLKDCIGKGETEESSVRQFGRHIAHPDIELFRTAFILARREGSSLAPCLQRLTKVIRQRQSFRRKIKAAVAMQKLSSLGIAGCTIFIGVIQAVMNPQALQDAIADPMGFKALVAGGLLILTGLVWMMQLASAKI